VVITGGSGLLGVQHAEAVAQCGASPVLLDLDPDRVSAAAAAVHDKFGVPALGLVCDITQPGAVEVSLRRTLERFGRADVLINNAANNTKMEEGDQYGKTSLEEFPLEQWQRDFDVAVTGALLCTRYFGRHMAERGRGVIVNMSSDLGIIAPDQRLYHRDGVPEAEHVYKPVSYSVVKHAIIGLTKYTATYWAHRGVRANALCPGGVFSGQPEVLVARLANLIPLSRMARTDEYKGAIQFLCSDASSYMNGACLVIDGGRSAW
jgi:NAD(P)-dependent dehydrogenase (short-subunit alcohol dehydrogenase family)